VEVVQAVALEETKLATVLCTQRLPVAQTEAAGMVASEATVFCFPVLLFVLAGQVAVVPVGQTAALVVLLVAMAREVAEVGMGRQPPVTVGMVGLD